VENGTALIDVRTGTARDVVMGLDATPAMVHADPPWRYDQGVGVRGGAQNVYSGMTAVEIAADIEATYALSARNTYLFVWVTFPKLGDWTQVHAGLSWEYITGGAWGKRVVGNWGAGHHFRGDAEVLMLYRKGKPKPKRGSKSNLWLSEREGHSKKPDAALHTFVEMATDPGDLVLDLYAGEFASLAKTCRRLNRRYIGAEACAERAALARQHLTQGGLRDGPHLPPVPARPA